MDDAVAAYCKASEANDMAALSEVMAPDVRLTSPLSGRMVFRGRDDVMALLTVVYASLKDLHWEPAIGEGSIHAAVATSRLAGFRVDDAMVLELDGEGRVSHVRPHLRPWLGLTAFALLVGPKLAGRPGLVLRALKG